MVHLGHFCRSQPPIFCWLDKIHSGPLMQLEVHDITKEAKEYQQSQASK